MKSQTKVFVVLVLSLALTALSFMVGIPEAAAFFTIITVLLIEVLRHEVKVSKPNH